MKTVQEEKTLDEELMMKSIHNLFEYTLNYECKTFAERCMVSTIYQNVCKEIKNSHR